MYIRCVWDRSNFKTKFNMVKIYKKFESEKLYDISLTIFFKIS
jgi:hypothetical protein